MPHEDFIEAFWAELSLQSVILFFVVVVSRKSFLQELEQESRGIQEARSRRAVIWPPLPTHQLERVVFNTLIPGHHLMMSAPDQKQFTLMKNLKKMICQNVFLT